MVRDVKKIPVRFIMKNAPYNIGEIAGFPEEVAKRFVDRKRAVYYEPETEVKTVAEPEAEAVAAVGPPPFDEPDDALQTPETETIVPRRLSGPWYMVGDKKVKGKADAEALADELNTAAAAAAEE